MIKKYSEEYTIQLSELCFYIFFCSLLFAKGIGLYDGRLWFKLFLVIALAGWGGKMLLTEYTVRELFWGLVPVILGGIIYLNTGEKGALFCTLLISGMKGIKLRRTFKIGLVTWLLSFGSLFFLTAFHVIDSHFKVHDKLGLGRIIRWSLGYAHPNVLHISYLVMVCFVVYLLGNKFKFRWFLVLEAVNVYVFMYSLSSTGFIAVTLCLVLALYWSFRKSFCKAEQILIQVCLPFCVLLSLVAPLALKGPVFSIVNKIVNTRLILSQWFLQNQPAQLLGVDTRGLVTSIRTMDNSYVFAYITNGIIFFVFMMAAYFVLIYQKSMKQDGIALCLILSCLVAGITEPFLFNTSFKNISLLFVGEMLFADEAKGKAVVPLLGKYDKELSLKLPDVKRILAESINNSVKYRKQLLAVALVTGVAAAGFGYFATKEPKRYIMPRTAFEYTDDIEETYYLSSEEDIPQTGDLVMGYVDKKTDMVPFTGNITMVERFRNTVSGGMVTIFLVYMVGSLWLWKKDGMKQTE